MSFDSLGLAPALLSSIQETGFTTPTPVQLAAIPAALAGKDLMVSSQTGSGKTAAFMLPALHKSWMKQIVFLTWDLLTISTPSFIVAQNHVRPCCSQQRLTARSLNWPLV